MYSEHYKQQLIEKHKEPRWGSTAHQWNTFLDNKIYGKILDYGCGKSTLELPSRTIYRYDPGIPGIDFIPEHKFNWVICIDVMEHVEPEYVDTVLDNIVSLAPNAFFDINTRVAKHILPDGSNAHLTVQPSTWWETKLKERYSEIQTIKTDIDYVCFARKKLC